MRKQELPIPLLAASFAFAFAGVTVASAFTGVGVGVVIGVAVGAVCAVAVAVAEVGIFGISTKKGTSEVFSPPGATAVRALQFLLPKKAYNEVFAQVVADTRDEYFAALAEGNNAKARWIRVRDSINLAIVFVQYLIVASLDRGMKIYKTFGSK